MKRRVNFRLDGDNDEVEGAKIGEKEKEEAEEEEEERRYWQQQQRAKAARQSQWRGNQKRRRVSGLHTVDVSDSAAIWQRRPLGRVAPSRREEEAEEEKEEEDERHENLFPQLVKSSAKFVEWKMG